MSAAPEAALPAGSDAPLSEQGNNESKNVTGDASENVTGDVSENVTNRALSDGKIDSLAGPGDPIAHWSGAAEDVSGSTVTDISGNGNDGMISGNVETGVTTPFGEGFTFDGDDDYIDLNTGLDGTYDQLSVSLWMKTDTLNKNFQGVLSSDPWETGNIHFQMNGDQLQVTQHGGGGMRTQMINDNQWHHVAYTLDSTDSGIRLYIDGQEVAQSDASDDAVLETLAIGRSNGGRYFDGTLADVRVYDRALSDGKIDSLADGNTESPGSVIGETGSVTLDNTIDAGEVETVSLEHGYSNPVVTAYIPSRNGGETIDARVKNVQSDSFEVFMEEPDDEGHADETVSWIVMEEGKHTLSDGTKVEAGTVSTDSVHRGGELFYGPNVHLDRLYLPDPVVVHSLNSYNNDEFMSSVSTNIDYNGFQLEQEAMETGNSASEETIGWMAFENIDGKSTVNGNTFYVDTIPHEIDGDRDGVDGSPESLSYSFDSRPDVVVDTQTQTGKDGMIARGAGTYTASAASFYAEEDQIGDDERGHADTGFGMVAFESGTVITEQASD